MEPNGYAVSSDRGVQARCVANAFRVHAASVTSSRMDTPGEGAEPAKFEAEYSPEELACSCCCGLRLRAFSPQILHIPPNLVVDHWTSDGESSSHRDVLLRHD